MKVRVSKQDPFLTILLIRSFLLHLSEHLISKVLVFLAESNFDDSLKTSFQKWVLVDLLKIILKMLFEECLKRFEDALKEF
jgi:hypothetical protein